MTTKTNRPQEPQAQHGREPAALSTQERQVLARIGRQPRRDHWKGLQRSLKSLPFFLFW